MSSGSLLSQDPDESALRRLSLCELSIGPNSFFIMFTGTVTTLEILNGGSLLIRFLGTETRLFIIPLIPPPPPMPGSPGIPPPRPGSAGVPPPLRPGRNSKKLDSIAESKAVNDSADEWTEISCSRASKRALSFSATATLTIHQTTSKLSISTHRMWTDTTQTG